MRWRRLTLAAVLVAAAAAVAYAAGKMMSVQVESATVRSEPNYFTGKEVAKLKHADRVEQIEEKGTWVKVKLADGQTGWISKESLTTKEIILKADDAHARGKASKEELALAGRGFNKDIEGKYRSQNPKLDYQWVDKMETDAAFQVAFDQLTAFLRAGGLLPAEGGAK